MNADPSSSQGSNDARQVSGNNQQPSNGDYLDLDQPAKSREQDRLGRRSLTEAIAQQIRSVAAEHGFTVAIVGEWGSGKTSLLNMVKETLEAEDSEIVILEFNPWLFGGATELVSRFFSELGAQLGRDRFKRHKEAAGALLELGELLAPHAPVPGASIVSAIFSCLTRSIRRSKSLLAIRDSLTEALQESRSKVLVLIDDIDRLEGSETRELFRLIRLTSDLPNVIFLLAFDRRRVARCLSECETEGRQYLDKIVQVSYDIPIVRQEVLPGLFFNWLKDLIEGQNLTRLDRLVWQQVFYDIIRPLLGNVRDVKRYLHSISVTLETVGKEVALADVLGLEAIRVLRPLMFEELKAQSECLVHPNSQSQVWETENTRTNRIQAALTAMIENSGNDRKVLESLLRILFPATQGFLGGNSYGREWARAWRKDQRVACDEVLRVYLQAGLDEGALSSNEFRELFEALTDERKLTLILSSFSDQQLEEALDRLEAFEEEIPPEGASISVPIFANQMKRLSPHSDGLFSFEPRIRAKRVILRLLRRIEDPDALTARLSSVIARIDSLSSRLIVIEMVGHRESVGHGLLSNSRASELERQLLDQLKAASAVQLEKEWDLATLVLRTVRWLEDDDKKWLAKKLSKHLRETGFLLTLLRTAVQYAHINNHVEKYLSWDPLMAAFGEELKYATERLEQSQLAQDLSDDDQDTIELAKNYASGWRPDWWREV